MTRSAKKSAWECECGEIAYGKLPPEECKKCWESDNFVELSEDEVEALEEKRLINEIRAKDVEDLDDDDQHDDGGSLWD